MVGGVRRGALLLVAGLLSGCSVLLDVELPPAPDVGHDVDLGVAADLGPAARGFGERCAGDLDCVSQRCRDRRCSAVCSEAAPCPAGSPTICAEGVCRFSTAPPLAGPPKVGFLYVGPVGDHGWTLTHDLSRRFLEDGLPGLGSSYMPSVTTTAAPEAIQTLIADGCNVVVGASYDFLVPVLSAAANHPEVNFLICSGFQTAPNLGSYFGRMYQVLWMAGKLAAHASRSGRLGVVAPVPIPETVRHINAFTRGARSVDPEAVVIVRWVNAWFDTVREPVATQELVAAGADVILSQTDTTIPLEVAADLTALDGGPVYTIGYDNPDSCSMAPEACLTAAYWNWGPMLLGILQQMVAGTWAPETPIWEQLESNPDQSSVYLAPINKALVSSAIQVEVESYIPQLAAPGVPGQQLPFAPPVVDNRGVVRLAEGGFFTDEELLQMCWFVAGVVEEVPASGSPIPAVVPDGCVGQR